MKRFIALVEQDPDKVILFKDYRIFKTADRGSFDEGFYHKACIIFLDSPYLETGLKVCYEDNEYWEYVCTENINPYLSLDYEESNIDLKKLGKFAERLGAKTKLKAEEQSALMNHPEGGDFADSDKIGNFNFTNTGISKDYNIPEFSYSASCSFNCEIQTDMANNVFPPCALPESPVSVGIRGRNSLRRILPLCIV